VAKVKEKRGEMRRERKSKGRKEEEKIKRKQDNTCEENSKRIGNLR